MIPKEIIIGGHKINCAEEDTKEIFRAPLGHAKLWLNKIKYSNEAVESIQEECVCHEILHHIFSVSGAIERLDTDKSGESGEKFIHNIENIFWRFLKDNTNFFNDKELK